MCQSLTFLHICIQEDPSVMAGQVLAALVGWLERKEWTAEESKILESLNKTLDYEVCELECVQKEIEKTGVDTMLEQLDPSPLMTALSNPGQQQQIIDPVLDKVVGSALAVTQACRPTTSACFQCMKVCLLSHILFIISIHPSFQGRCFDFFPFLIFFTKILKFSFILSGYIT